MAGLIMLGLLALMVLTLIMMLLMRQGWKRILVVFVGFIVVIEIFSSYVTKTCGPNAKDVEIMTPQAEAISNYILKNGIPESLSQISGLPYKLEECKRTKTYSRYSKQKHKYIYNEIETDATGEIIKEICIFQSDNRKYAVNIRFDADYKIGADYLKIKKCIDNIDAVEEGKGELVFYNEVSETGIDYFFTFNSKLREWIYTQHIGENPNVYSSKHDGICNPLRQ